jgi:hypothetical protein
VHGLKKSLFPRIAFLYSMLLVIFASLCVNVSIANVTTLSPFVDIQVDHALEIRHGGLVIIYDTVRLSTQPGENADLLQDFRIGFPFNYKSNLDYCFAYDTSLLGKQLDVVLDAGLGKIGFYAVNVIFSEPINVSDGRSYSFTVVFVFSNLITPTISLSYPDLLMWNVTFPLYPSLLQGASVCNVTVLLPMEAKYSLSAPITEDDFSVSTQDSRQFLNYTQSELESFAMEPAWLMFYEQQSLVSEVFLMIDINELRRDITLDQWGQIFVSEFYHLTYRGEWNLSVINICLPQGINALSARNETGDLDVLLKEGNVTVPTNATIILGNVVEKDRETKLTVTYWLPSRLYLTQHNWRNFDLVFSFFGYQYFKSVIRKLTTAITLPEGARFLRLPNIPENLRRQASKNLQSDVFQESLTYTFYNVTPFHELHFDLTYDYLVFWSSFRPTLWVGVVILVVSVIALLWRVPKPSPVPITPVPSENLRSFVNTYGKKTSLFLELEALERQLRRGKIPRRRYKIRRKAMEGRLSVLSRDLSSLREKIRAAGPRYANIMRQIEVAETELEGAETDIRRIEARYRRGEISKGAYNRLLGEYHRRRERAQVTIDGVLLRLREEIR